MSQLENKVNVRPMLPWKDLDAVETRGKSFKSLVNSSLTLHSRQWIPRQNIRALVFYAHGFYDHAAQPGTDALCRTLNDYGYAVFCVDMEGHGESEGLRGYLDAKAGVRNILHLIEITRKEHPNLPFFVMGHSMGGLHSVEMSLKFGEENDPLFKGAVLYAPALLFPDAPPSPIIGFMRYCLLPCCPSWQCICIPPPDYESQFTDKEAIQIYTADPYLIEVKVRIETGETLLTAMNETRARSPQLRTPFLLVQGDQDFVIDHTVNLNLMKTCKTPEADKTLLLLPGAKHDVLHDHVREQVVTATVNWLEGRMNKA